MRTYFKFTYALLILLILSNPLFSGKRKRKVHPAHQGAQITTVPEYLASTTGSNESEASTTSSNSETSGEEAQVSTESLLRLEKLLSGEGGQASSSSSSSSSRTNTQAGSPRSLDEDDGAGVGAPEPYYSDYSDELPQDSYTYDTTTAHAPSNDEINYDLSSYTVQPSVSDESTSDTVAAYSTSSRAEAEFIIDEHETTLTQKIRFLHQGNMGKEYAQIEHILRQVQAKNEIDRGNPLGMLIARLNPSSNIRNNQKYNDKLLKLVSTLLNYGATTNTKNEVGDTPFSGLVRCLQPCGLRLQNTIEILIDMQRHNTSNRNNVTIEETDLNERLRRRKGTIQNSMNAQIYRHIQLLLYHNANPNLPGTAIDSHNALLPIALLIEKMKEATQNLPKDYITMLETIVQIDTNAEHFSTLFPSIHATLTIMMRSEKLDAPSLQYLANLAKDYGNLSSKYVSTFVKMLELTRKKQADANRKFALEKARRRREKKRPVEFTGKSKFNPDDKLEATKVFDTQYQTGLKPILQAFREERFHDLPKLFFEGDTLLDNPLPTGLTPLSMVISCFDRNMAEHLPHLVYELLLCSTDANLDSPLDSQPPLYYALIKLTAACNDLRSITQPREIETQLSYIETLTWTVKALCEAGADTEYIFQDNPLIVAVLALIDLNGLAANSEKVLRISENFLTLIESILQRGPDVTKISNYGTVYHWLITAAKDIKDLKVTDDVTPCLNLETIHPFLHKLAEKLVLYAVERGIDIYALTDKHNVTVRELACAVELPSLFDVFDKPSRNKKGGCCSCCSIQ